MAYSIVRKFERTIADFCGAKYAVSISSCTNAIFLCLQYLDYASFITKNPFSYVELPHRTYPGVAAAIKHSGKDILFVDKRWVGQYALNPTPIIDSALRFKKNMYRPGSLMCLSFHARKHIPIGRGGMVLTDDLRAVKWLKRLRYDGRDEKPLLEDNIKITGWNMYLTPEQAARGLQLFQLLDGESQEDIDDYDTYADLAEQEAFK